ncbi:MAG: hypothetical protein E7576_03765 [Ruminococcaceae bacterium]|nr:hypothetical protein [Oscillospiraceae bacterium]
MSFSENILQTPVTFLLLMGALFLMIGQTAVLLLPRGEENSRRRTLTAALHFVIGFAVFVFLFDGYDLVHYAQIPRDSVQTGWFPYKLPWPVYAALEIVSAGIILHRLREYKRCRTSTVTSATIRQAVDLLPEGICVSSSKGTPLLVNLKMDALCRALTGERLSDAEQLWEFLEENGENQEGKRLMKTPRGEAWLFARDDLPIDGVIYKRLNAVNVTERYRITEELRAKNAHLQEVRHRMRETSELSAEMFVKQEEAAARTALHNELGQVLLMGRRCLEHPDTTDKATVARMTREMNRILLRERKMPQPESPDGLRQAIDMAGRIGVTVDVKGGPVEEERLRALLAEAIRECAANTVKHAEGDRLWAQITETAAFTSFSLRNNGKPPRGPIDESGGLLSLRRMVEEAGGKMIVQSLPVFSLTIVFLRS